MSDLNYYGAHPHAGLPHRAGLTVWGVVLIVVGGIFGFSALIAAVAVPVMVAFRAPASRPTAGTDVRLMVTVAAGVVTAAALAGGLVWLGVGSCRGRRWVRPVVVAGGPLVIAFGSAAILNMAAALVRAITTPAPAGPPAAGPVPPQALLVVTSAFALIFAAGLYVVLPAVMVWFYGRPSVADTLSVLDPVRRWTDGVDVPLLRWVMACGYTGAVMIVLAAGGTWVAFTAVLDGWSAAAPLLVVGGTLAVAAVGSYRRSAAARAVGVAAFALLAASTLTFAVAGDPAEYFRQMVDRMAGLTGAAGNNAFARNAAGGGRLLWAGTGVVYALLAGYGVRVRLARDAGHPHALPKEPSGSAADPSTADHDG